MRRVYCAYAVRDIWFGGERLGMKENIFIDEEMRQLTWLWDEWMEWSCPRPR